MERVSSNLIKVLSSNPALGMQQRVEDTRFTKKKNITFLRKRHLKENEESSYHTRRGMLWSITLTLSHKHSPLPCVHCFNNLLLVNQLLKPKKL